jgi:predicted PurR-regulated permease PerM
MQRAFFTVGTVALVTALLYWGQVVLVPLALAILIGFVLSTPAAWLEALGLPRVVSVLIAGLLGFAILGAVCTVAGWEIRGLGQTMSDPQYKDNIKRVMAPLRALIEQVEELQKIGEEVRAPVQPSAPNRQKPLAVVVESNGTGVLNWLPGLARPLLELLAQGVLVVVLSIFIMAQRESLRDRVIRLIGKQHLPGTTRALDDAAGRVSRYLLLQTCTNALIGVGVALGLFLAGVPYAALWGVLAAALRFVPYVGIWLAAALPFGLSLVVFPGWLHALAVLGIFLVLELTMSNLVEPLLFGRGTGVMPMALLIVAVFWLWLWGPIGLLLSTPLTVCLVVLGKYVPALAFFDVLLGDTSPLGPADRYYQRLLAGDQDEATGLIQDQMKDHAPEAVYDRVLLPALVRARADLAREEIGEEEERRVVRTTRDVLEDVLAHIGPVGPGAVGEASGNGHVAARPAVRVLGCPARGREDELALRMLGQLLQPMGAELEIVPPRRLVEEARAAGDEQTVVCIAALPPGGVSHAVALCRRVRAAAPNVKILVGRWGQHEDVEGLRDSLRQAGADAVGTSLLETRQQILPPEEAQREAAAAAGQFTRA